MFFICKELQSIYSVNHFLYVQFKEKIRYEVKCLLCGIWIQVFLSVYQDSEWVLSYFKGDATYFAMSLSCVQKDLCKNEWIRDKRGCWHMFTFLLKAKFLWGHWYIGKENRLRARWIWVTPCLTYLPAR